MSKMRVVRFFAVMFVGLALIMALLYLFRMPVAGFAVRSVMGNMGLESPKAKVSALSLDGITLNDLAAGPSGGEAFALDEIEVSYDWRALISDKKVDAVRVGSGTVRVKLSEDGSVSLPGISMRSGNSSGSGALPFFSLALDDIALLIDAPLGNANGILSADYDQEKGGVAAIHLVTDEIGSDLGRVENGTGDLSVRLSDDGLIVIDGNFLGDVFSPYGAVRDVNVALKSEGASWRDLANGVRDKVEGELSIEVNSAIMNMSDLASTGMMTSEQTTLMFGEPVSTLSFAGGIGVSLVDGVITADLGSVPMMAGADNGAQLVLAALEDAPFFQWSDDDGQANFSYDLKGARISANGTLNAQTTKDGWFVVTPIRVGDYRSENVSFDDTSAILRINTKPGGLKAEITTTTNLREMSVGRLSVYEAPFAASFIVEADHLSKTAQVFLPEGQCVSVEDARVTIEQQNTEVSFKGARLCGQERPLAVIGWSDDMYCEVAGNLTATRMDYRLGQTKIVGRLPVVDFEATYQPTLNQTVANGTVSGGALVFNDMAVFSSVSGDYDFSLDKDTMQSSINLDSVRIVQNLETPLVAPFLGSGTARLMGSQAEFDYVLKTMSGRELGVGHGRQNVETASGQSTIIFDRVEFGPEGLQPSLLAPVMTGVIGETTGVFSGEANFAWAPDPVGLTSTARFGFEDITFGGPTLVVTKTIGVNGEMAFTNLWPVTTDGVQTITVAGIDFGALQLEQGEINFKMPGDETLHIVEAMFPWFGGELAVHDAIASFTGGDALAKLEANNLDLAQILDYADVNGLSGEGILSGVLPLVVEEGKARIQGGVLESVTPGVINYQGGAASEAASAAQDSQVAFDLLRDLRFAKLGVNVDGELDGRLQFKMNFEGTGELELNQQNVRVPVIYRINLDAALLELLNQANLSRDIQLQIERGLSEEP